MKKRKAKRIVYFEKPSSKESNSTGFGYHIPPDFENVMIYFSQKCESELAANFFKHFQSSEWRTATGALIRKWKVAATDWIYDHRQSLKLAQRKLENILSK